MRTIAVINQKGGCGKTTTAVNLAACFAARRFRTLLIDSDPQSHCAAALGVPENQIEKDLSDALLAPLDRSLDLERLVWRISRGFDLVPSRTRLAGLEAVRGGLAEAPDREQRMKSVIRKLANIDPETEQPNPRYDICLIDCPPSIGLLTFNALVAASEILIPVETSFFSMRGASKQLATIRSISRRLGVRPRCRILPTLHNRSAPAANDLLAELRETFQEAVIPTVIRYDQALKDAASQGRPACEFDPESHGAQDYASLCEWLIEHAEIDRATSDEMLEFEGEINLGRRTSSKSESLNPPTLRVPQAAEASSASTPASAPRSHPESRMEDLARRARAMHRAKSEITPKPKFSAVALRSCFTPTMPCLPPPNKQAALAPQTAAQAGGLSTMTRLARPVAIELLEPEPEVRVVSSIRHLLGVRRTSRGALFVQPGTNIRHASVAGSFNGWSASLNPMRFNESLGVFELQIELLPGQHEYQLVLDGMWGKDRYNPIHRPNDFGGINSLIDLADLNSCHRK